MSRAEGVTEKKSVIDNIVDAIELQRDQLFRDTQFHLKSPRDTYKSGMWSKGESIHTKQDDLEHLMQPVFEANADSQEHTFEITPH